MLSLEQEVRDFLQNRSIFWQDHSQAFDRLDFSVKTPELKRPFHFDVKEKRQRYNLDNWNLTKTEEQHTFILDDLAARKTLAYAPRSGLIIRDNLSQSYHFFSIVDLFLMPKQRVNRPIHRTHPAWKGKWLINLQNATLAPTFAEAFQQLLHYATHQRSIFTSIKSCYGEYVDEDIPESGQVRQPSHWKTDVEETR